MQAEGAVVVIGDIDPVTGQAVADELNVTFVQVDVSDEAAVDRLFDTAFEVHGGSRHRLQQRRDQPTRR